MSYSLGIDLGTTFVAAAISRDGQRVEMVPLGDRTVTEPSVVLRRDDGSLAVGDDKIVIDRISEQLQSDSALMHRLDTAGLRPGLAVSAKPVAHGVQIWLGDGPQVFGDEIRDHVFVRVG